MGFNSVFKGLNKPDNPHFTYDPKYSSSIEPSSGVNYVIKITQDEKCAYKLNTEERSRNRRCCGKKRLV